MSEDENENNMSLDEERKKLKDLGVDSTWNILSSGEKKKKNPEDEEKPVFRGFK
ncbi:MAG: hypothetical protein ACFFDY_03080 [Candidatus Thorarchaeota archaeon]